ncbi:uncharacterized protein C8Q71DRAFT_372065 [Rhodofomes roseus]|uniref:Uncharacterized protein n=1 Tax=Rhodofomes roseus TaxID=34475 RepID=A0ABQ8K0U3_9APHY|nr:uncharacterized protein C8Q71DRAFT_372065 [Rhodofomes roseus]KAH9830273.1 hypothetical protein C8Q71DRAFT_372065 [Rhodofomes roseus]
MVVALTLLFLAVNKKLGEPTKGQLVEMAMENKQRVGMSLPHSQFQSFEPGGCRSGQWRHASAATVSTETTPLPASFHTSPIKILAFSADGYTESSVLALTLLMAWRKLSLPEAYACRTRSGDRPSCTPRTSWC